MAKMSEIEKIENCHHCGYPSIYGHADDCLVCNKSQSKKKDGRLFKNQKKEKDKHVKK